MKARTHYYDRESGWSRGAWRLQAKNNLQSMDPPAESEFGRKVGVGQYDSGLPKGFQKRDGVAEAIKQLTRVFQSYKKNTKPFVIALVNFKKAFDSVSHNAKVSTLVRRSVPTWLIDYIKDLYNESCTILDGELRHPKRRIRQRDPSSPHLFNLAQDEVLRMVPSNTGH